MTPEQNKEFIKKDCYWPNVLRPCSTEADCPCKSVLPISAFWAKGYIWVYSWYDIPRNSRGRGAGGRGGGVPSVLQTVYPGWTVKFLEVRKDAGQWQ